MAFPKNDLVLKQLKQILGLKWSQTIKAWHIPYDKDSFNQLKAIFPTIEYEHTKQLKKDVETPKESEPIHYFPSDDSCNLMYYGKRILIFMKPNDEIIKQFQSFKGVFFDSNKKAWSLPNSSSNIALLSFLFKNKVNFLNKEMVALAPTHHQIRIPNTVKIVITPS